MARPVHLYAPHHLIRLLIKLYCTDAVTPSWRAYHYLYWMYEKSINAPLDDMFIERMTPLCEEGRQNKLVCQAVSVSTFLRRFRAMWPSMSGVHFSDTWGIHNDVLLADGVREAKRQSLVSYIMTLCTSVELFENVRNAMGVDRKMFWCQVNAIGEVKTLAKIIQTFRLLNVENFIPDENSETLHAFAWPLCATFIRVFCPRTDVETTNWSKPSSVHAALFCRYTTETHKTMVGNIFHDVVKSVRAPIVQIPHGGGVYFEPLSIGEWVAGGRCASIVENCTTRHLYHWVRPRNTVYMMDERGYTEVYSDTVTPIIDEQDFLALGGTHARVYVF